MGKKYSKKQKIHAISEYHKHPANQPYLKEVTMVITLEDEARHEEMHNNATTS